ncbi:MAG: hypothetical protein R3346_03480 [Candidatus Spechtbacterales bacterium]|nr:hypothetical protein [Candidatus Spechtbacterales bacterium]
MAKAKTDRFIIASRLDYPSDGARRGLWLNLANTAVEEEADFIIIAGGLTSHYGIGDRIKEATAKGVAEQKALKAAQKDLPKEEREDDIPTLVQVRKNVRESVLSLIAHELAEMIPVVIDKDGKPLKYYVTTSRAHSYDGPYGMEVVRRLAGLREDIIYWDEESARFELKHNEDKVLWVLNPEKAPWRGKYYSTTATRLVQDKIKQTSQSLPDLFVVGCLAASLYEPAGGEKPVPMATVPGLHKLQEVKTSENQVGFLAVEFSSERRVPLVRTYSLKDLVKEERSFIQTPDGLEDDDGLSKRKRHQRERQRTILRQVIKDIPTIGMLEDALRWKRSTIERDIENYNNQGFEPAIISSADESNKYDVSREWLQYDLDYPQPSKDDMVEDTFLTFCCLHAGYKHTQYRWFVQRLPEIIQENNIQCLVGCGDFIAGLKHNLDRRDELLPGMNNYVKQEKYAAELVGQVIISVFRERFDACLSRKRKKPDAKKLEKMLHESLIDFRFWRGNHDEWVQDLGFEPLNTFRIHLASFIVEGVYEYLAELGFALSNVSDIVRSHIFYSQEHTLPSGLTLSVRHPHQGRMQTSSGRAQQTLSATPGRVVALGNFHTSIAVQEWNSNDGQRLAVQTGTITSGTDFEYNMNKLVDTGVGIARVLSDPKTNRIFITDLSWDSPAEEDIINFDNDKIISSMMDYIIKDHN